MNTWEEYSPLERILIQLAGAVVIFAFLLSPIWVNLFCDFLMQYPLLEATFVVSAIAGIFVAIEKW